MSKQLQVELNSQEDTKKYAKLFLGIFFDLVGMISYIIPFAAEIIDLIWAPISGLILAKMYPGNVGKFAGILGFIEELLPETDIIPTFTLTWIYVYIIRKRS